MIDLIDKNAKEGASKDLRNMKYLNLAVRLGLGLLVGAFVFLLLPYAVTMASNMFQLALYLTGTAIVGAAGVAVVFTAWICKPLLKRKLERWVNNLWEKFIKDDPIKYIQEEITGFRVQLAKVGDAIRKLRGILDELRSMGQQTIDEANHNIELADNAANEKQAALYAYYATTSIDTKEGIMQSYKEIDESVAILTEMDEMLDMNIKMMEHDVNNMQLNMRIQAAKSSAADSFNSILQGNPDARAKREIAVQAYKQKVSAYSANFKQTMSKFQPLLEAKRIEDAITTKQGQALLTEFRENGKKLAGLDNFKDQLEKLKQQTGFFGDGDDAGAFKRVQNASATPFKSKGKFSNL